MATIIERTTLLILEIALAMATATTLRTAVEDTLRPGLETIQAVIEATR